MAGVTETAHNKLKERVQALETATPSSSWVQKHQVLTWLISLTLVILTIIVSIYSGAIPHIEKDANLQITNQVNEGLRQPPQKIGQMGEDLAGIKATLNAWSPLITPLAFKKSLSLPQDQFEKALPELKAVAQMATESKTPASDKDISAVGQRTLSLVKSSSSHSNLAWETMNSLLQYRSALNNLTPPANLGDAKPASTNIFVTKYFTHTRPGLPSAVLSWVGAAPKDQAAMLNEIGKDFNANLDKGNALLVLRGNSIQLDSMQMQNVALINVNVIYEGGPVILENVYFLDCAFEIKKTAHSQALSAHLIEPSPTNYSLPVS